MDRYSIKLIATQAQTQTYSKPFDSFSIIRPCFRFVILPVTS